MKKTDVKNILMSLRNSGNEEYVNNLLGKIDMMDERLVEKMLNKIGNDYESIKSYLQEKILKETNQISDEKYPINNMFTYGVTGDCVHLHLPGYLYKMFEKNGFSRSMDIVNVHLLDALTRLNTLKNSGFYKLENARNVYMISPLLIAREVRFLEDMHFSVRSFTKKQLRDDEFLAQDSEAKLAVNIFGRDKNVGSAMISFYTLNSKEWQYDKDEKLKDFADKGISLDDEGAVK